MNDKQTVILYHGSMCPDGFGAAYSAWKKFGDTAEYVTLSRGEEVPLEIVRGKEVYFLDFVYDDVETMKRYEEAAKSLTALDHHTGVRQVTESMKSHVFDHYRSGAGIAWDYFHPGTKRPRLIDLLEDDDLFNFKYPDTRPMLAYLGLHPFDFQFWDEVVATLEDAEKSETLLAKARVFGECFEKLANISVEKAKKIRFEGYETSFAIAHPYKPIVSLVGNLLARKLPPIALVVSAHPNGYGVSIRGDGSVDVSKIAAKYGGNGHPDSSGFLIPRTGPFPWELIKDEDTRN